MAGQDRPGLVDQHRHGEAELPDAGDDLSDLLLGMGAGIPRPRGEGRRGTVRDLRSRHEERSRGSGPGVSSKGQLLAVAMARKCLAIT